MSGGSCVQILNLFILNRVLQLYNFTGKIIILYTLHLNHSGKKDENNYKTNQLCSDEERRNVPKKKGGKKELFFSQKVVLKDNE